ncbi:hypothetical protein WH87_15510 [Devosia epidermidihirudinis]|uniref:CENP-V/GFA domain-containing protein n=1 Tax=Devosia epidermidihirudinis TaxID=1293439 RepID=A0A0F5Q3M3_9HYPH|nr:GFA family protein [Devosia epidermidihirudinis]KKC35485.1 hypothetical protein WH87_15510 [Devosia epidermidihirudinis]
MSTHDYPEINLTTRCDCGAVKLTAKGRIVSMFLCSCLNCQRITGSGHASPVVLPADAVSLIGATKSHSRTADSGAIFTRHFCPECGTTLYAASSRAPALRLVPAGLFAGQNDWFEPNQVIFSRSRQAWDLISDHLPLHDTYRPDVSK